MGANHRQPLQRSANSCLGSHTRSIWLCSTVHVAKLPLRAQLTQRMRSQFSVADMCSSTAWHRIAAPPGSPWGVLPHHHRPAGHERLAMQQLQLAASSEKASGQQIPKTGCHHLLRQHGCDRGHAPSTPATSTPACYKLDAIPTMAACTWRLQAMATRDL